jgi:hypothetical protein
VVLDHEIVGKDGTESHAIVRVERVARFPTTASVASPSDRSPPSEPTLRARGARVVGAEETIAVTRPVSSTS